MYLDDFLLCLTCTTHTAVLRAAAAATTARLLLLLLLTHVHRPEQVLHLLYLEVVPQSSHSAGRQRRQLTARGTR